MTDPILIRRKHFERLEDVLKDLSVVASNLITPHTPRQTTMRMASAQATIATVCSELREEWEAEKKAAQPKKLDLS